MRNKYLPVLALLAAMLWACVPKPHDAKMLMQEPGIYPDYAGATVPVNIAPLNFLLTDACEAVYATAGWGDDIIVSHGRGSEVKFGIDDWHSLLQKAAGDEVLVVVSALREGKWVQYLPFAIFVSADSIDPYLTYRLIEPDYEVYSRLQIKERCLEDFSERPIADYSTAGNRCMNCHTYGSNRADLSFLYLRGEGGGMILNRGGELRKLNLRAPDMSSGSVYAQFSPDGRYLAFSTNVIIPGFHSSPAKRLEVFDTKSDIYIADLDNNRILRSPQLADSARLETFPAFAPDGKSLYFCTAPALQWIGDIERLQYSLCRIDFDPAAGRIGEKADTVVSAVAGEKTSVCHPRVSPDGRFLLYTVADYGTFPIWHRESDQQMLDLSTGETLKLDQANSDQSDTYHSWSTTGRWFVFASKRDDGLYGKPYFCHVDPEGRVGKPFVLPQRSPGFYQGCLKSFNAPELGRAPVPFTSIDIADMIEADSENFR